MIKLFLTTFFFVPVSFITVLSQGAPEYLPNFPIQADSVYQPIFYGATPIVCDFDREGGNEILFALHKPQNSRIYLVQSDGSFLNGWPVTITQTSVWPAIAAGDINKDGFIDIIVRTEKVFAFDYSGNLLPGFPISLPHEHLSMIALYDLDNNGYLEIITIGNNYLYVFNHNGSLKEGWPIRLPGQWDQVLVPPVSIGDLNGDKQAEIIAVSSYCYGQGICDSSYVHVLKQDGSYLNGWPLRMDSNYVFYSQTPTIYSNNNNSFILSNSALYYPPNFDSTRTRTSLYKNFGESMVKNYTVAYGESSSIPLAMLGLDTVKSFGSEPLPVYLFKNSNLITNGILEGNGYYYNSPTLGKFSSNLSVATYLRFIDTSLRSYFHFHNLDGTELEWSPLRPIGIPAAAPVICDINKDGQTDIALLTKLDTSMMPRSKLHIWTFPGVPYNRDDNPWPMFGHDRYRTFQYGFVPPDEPVGIQPMSTDIPESYSLYQNFPNPFNTSTRIKFDIRNRNNVKIKIYDALGREVHTLINENLNPGFYSLILDMDKFSSGVYFYTLSAEDFIQTKKMLLIR